MCYACGVSSQDLYDTVATDRGNFVISTMSILPEDGMIPGIEYVTSLIPTGILMFSRKDYRRIALLSTGAGYAPYIQVAYGKEESEANHERAIMLASTHDFPWQDDEDQRKLMYGFTAEEREALDELT